MRFPSLTLRRAGRKALATVLFLTSALGMALAALVNTTDKDYLQPGTQPNTLTDAIAPSGACYFCHGNYDPDHAPFERWSASMMANSTRDPVFHAALAIANQDAAESGELCIRCHAPGGWLGGNSSPTDGSALSGVDYDGVTCHFCHRMVDPIADAANPFADTAILNNLTAPPTDPSHNGQYIIDPADRRRAPFDPSVCQNYHLAEQSPFHQESLLCATCHDVSNPVYTRVGGPVPAPTDTYVLNALDAPHPTHNRYDQFPIERTYSEWLMSDFGQGPVDMGGLFGGNKQLVSSCQDCHMPDTTGTGCAPGFGGPQRSDLPQHDFNGANSWVPLAIYSLDQSLLLYGASEASQVPLADFQAAVARNIDMLQRASDMDLTHDGDSLNVRITNNSGHKLPSGYPEGRRMWINVQFFDGQGVLIQEHGHYDSFTATLTTTDTKVYEMDLGPDAVVAGATGLPEAPSFHFVLNNKIYKDNRIPPRGFTNANFESIQAHPVGYSYADGQFWDDTVYAVPCDAASATVTVFHQTTSREYIEFLKNENVTNNAGQIAYDEWMAAGMSAPVVMDTETVVFAPRLAGDVATISVAAGGTQTMCLNAGPAHAGKFFWVLGSVSGTSPGVSINGLTMPLNFDPYFNTTILLPNLPPFVNSFGNLDADGQATTLFTLPGGGLFPNLIGVHADHAYAVINGALVAEVASNPLGLDFVN